MGMDVLLTGGAGQIGTELLRQPWPHGVILHAPDRGALDLANPASITEVLESRRWSAIISSGAYTAVDRAEADVEIAWRVNALAPAVMAYHANRAGIPIVHVSTDYVFDGTKDGFYDEGDPVAPINVYGASKEGGEQAIRTARKQHAIVRTAWVVSSHRENFLKTMLRLARERHEVAIVADQRGCPTFAGDVAAALMLVTVKLVEDPALSGTYHFVNAGEASWSEFAEAVFAASADLNGPTARVRGISTADYPTPAIRPANSRLATSAIQETFGIVPRPWSIPLRETLMELSAL